jgi:hypothetical protein
MKIHPKVTMYEVFSQYLQLAVAVEASRAVYGAEVTTGRSCYEKRD